LVAFDASNKEHRRFYWEFLEENTWGRCPVRFICPEETGQDLVKMIQKQMVEYYVRQEFKNNKPKTQLRGKRTIGLTSGGFGVTIDA
jgi:hypothetical protein